MTTKPKTKNPRRGYAPVPPSCWLGHEAAAWRDGWRWGWTEHGLDLSDLPKKASITFILGYEQGREAREDRRG